MLSISRTFATIVAVSLTVIAPAVAGSSGQDFSLIERGRYLTIAGDCAGCHTKPEGPDFAEWTLGRNAVRQCRRSKYHARQRDRHWRMERR